MKLKHFKISKSNVFFFSLKITSLYLWILKLKCLIYRIKAKTFCKNFWSCRFWGEKWWCYTLPSVIEIECKYFTIFYHIYVYIFKHVCVCKNNVLKKVCNASNESYSMTYMIDQRYFITRCANTLWFQPNTSNISYRFMNIFLDWKRLVNLQAKNMHWKEGLLVWKMIGCP